MIFATTASSIAGYKIVAFKGTAQGATFEELLHNTEILNTNAVLIVCYDNVLSTDTPFHGSPVVIERPRFIDDARRGYKTDAQAVVQEGEN